MSGNLGGSARDVTAPVRVIENQLRKIAAVEDRLAARV